MAFHIYSWTWETSSTTGNGPITLGGAVAGWRPFSAQYADGDTLPYAIYDGTNFEEGRGTYHAGTNTLSRDTVVRSTNSNAAVNWGAGTRQVVVSPSGYDFEQLLSAANSGHIAKTGNPSAGTPTGWTSS